MRFQEPKMHKNTRTQREELTALPGSLAGFGKWGAEKGEKKGKEEREGRKEKGRVKGGEE